jgi:hypothetical protein
VAAALLFVAPTLSLAQGSNDRDVKEVSAYRLTETSLARFEKATRNLTSLPAGTFKDCSDDDAPQSLDALVARIDANAAAHGAIQAAGMSTRDYALFTFSVFQAGMAAWALEQPGAKAPTNVSMDNIAFYRKHAAELKTLRHESHLQCGDDDENG